MRPQKVEGQQLLIGLMSVLRTKGYDGASLNDLAKSTGLQKASLYHRYPGGKKDIAQAVLSFVEAWSDEHILQPLHDQHRAPLERLSTALDRIKILYDNGEATCLYRALLTGSSSDLFGEELKSALTKWLSGFTVLGVALGLDQRLAEEKALKVLVTLQGSLIVAQGLQDTLPFTRALSEIERMYKDTSDLQHDG